MRSLFFQLLVVCFCAIFPCHVNAVEPFNIISSTVSSNDGGFTLSWTLPAGSRIELQQASIVDAEDDAFKTIYLGSDSASVITGLPDGDYLFRARLQSADGIRTNWTESLNVEVRHHSLFRAFSFFTVGAIVFLATLLLVLKGEKT